MTKFAKLLAVVFCLTLTVSALPAQAAEKKAEKKQTRKKTSSKPATPASAEITVTETPAVTGSDYASPDESREGALRLSLEDAIRSSVERNLGVHLQRYEYRSAGYRARAAYGAFDWYSFATLQTQSEKAPITSVIFSAQSDRSIANFGIQQTIPTGGNYTIGFNNARQESNNRFTTVNPAFSSGLSLAANQPLLRNFGVDVTRRGVNIARNNLGISRESFRSVLTNTVYSVEQAYYDLIFARQNLEVKRQSLALGNDQARITQIRIDVGASAPLDILQPRVAIATREEEVIFAEARIRDAEDRLRQLMNLPPSEWDQPIIPTSTIAYRPMEIDMPVAVATAFSLRPEIGQARLITETRRIERLYARNQVLPQLDLNVQYGLAGLGGNRIIRDPVTGEQIGIEQGGYGDALEQVSGFDFPAWSVGFTVGIPITNIGARSEARRAELDLERSTHDQDRVRQNIAVEVRQAARDIETLARQIVATRAARDAAEKNVDAERKRFANGMTTNFNVLLVQQELSDTRSREIAALVAYNKAIANYHRAVGDILQVHDIAVEVPENFSIPSDRFENVDWMNYGHYSE